MHGQKTSDYMCSYVSWYYHDTYEYMQLLQVTL
jgi:hypothetical protein